MNAYQIIKDVFKKQGFEFKEYVYIDDDEYLYFVNNETGERLNITCEVV